MLLRILDILCSTIKLFSTQIILSIPDNSTKYSFYKRKLFFNNICIKFKTEKKVLGY